MKAKIYVFILLNLVYLTKCEQAWLGTRISQSNLRELAKFAKVTQDSGNMPFAIGPRISKSYTRTNSRQSRIEEEKINDEGSEVLNNTISEEEMDRSTRQSVTEVTAGSSVQPGRREAAGKRKQPTKMSISPKPAITEGTPKPTKYHYYPHNQHIYLLPECAIQQVCNAVYVRLNYTQPLCACPSRKEPCSASLNADDLHTTELVTASTGKVLTLVKTCEPVAEMRICRAPRDWSLLALQNVRTGKSHYLVICRCPHKGRLEGPMSHDQPAYASVPGIRVYGMMCVRDSYRISRPFRYRRSINDSVTGSKPQFPWEKLKEFQSTIEW